MARGYKYTPSGEVAEEQVETQAPAPVTPAPPVVEQAKPTESSQAPLVLVSENDAYIHELMKSQPKTMDEVEIKSVRDLGEHKGILALPQELEKYCDKYAFRWVNKKKRAIDHAITVTGWTFVNRLLFDDLPKYLFTANGSVERGDAILMFIPLEIAKKIRLKPAQISRERVRNLPVQDLRNWKDRGNENHYKPDLGAAEDDSEKSAGMVVVPDNEPLETGISKE